MPRREASERYPDAELFVRELTKVVMELVASHYLRDHGRTAMTLLELNRVVEQLLAAKTIQPPFAFQPMKLHDALAHAVRGVASSASRTAKSRIIKPGEKSYGIRYAFREAVAWSAFQLAREEDVRAAEEQGRKPLGVRPLCSLVADRSSLSAEFVRNVVRDWEKRENALKRPPRTRQPGKKLAKSL